MTEEEEYREYCEAMERGHYYAMKRQEEQQAYEVWLYEQQCNLRQTEQEPC